MLHLLILGLLTILAVGFVTISVVARHAHQRASPLVARLVVPLLWFNLRVLVWLAFVTVQSLPGTIEGPVPGSVVEVTLHAGHATLVWLWLISLAGFVASALDGTGAERVRRAMRVARLVTAAVGMSLWAALFVPGWAWWALPFLRFTSVAIDPLALAISLWLVGGAAGARGQDVTRTLRSLGGLYSAVFTGSTLWLLWTLLVSPAHKRFLVVNLAFDVLYNAASVAWVLCQDVSLAESRRSEEVQAQVPADGLDHLVTAYGVSRREREVAALICQGKTNQEIADLLFISLKTVKDHNYRIFQKTGVRNRVELVRLVTDPRRSVAD